MTGICYLSSDSRTHEYDTRPFYYKYQAQERSQPTLGGSKNALSSVDISAKKKGASGAT